jgi:hypothetical protein
VAVRDVNINCGVSLLEIDSSFLLRATIIQDNAANQEVVWFVNNRAIAEVDNLGRVTGIAAGTANISVRTVDGGITKNCAVNVYRAVTGINLNVTDTTLFSGEMLQLSYTIQPADATNRNVRWESNNPKIMVNNTGKVTIEHGESGEAIINVVTQDRNKIAACTINYVPIPTSVETKQIQPLRIYPNPVNDEIRILDEYDRPIEIYDLVGKLLIITMDNVINTSNLPIGNYIVKTGTKAVMIIKQ